MTNFVYKGLTRNLEIGNQLPKESGGESGIPSFTRIPLVKSYLLLQSARFTALTVSELLRKN